MPDDIYDNEVAGSSARERAPILMSQLQPRKWNFGRSARRQWTRVRARIPHPPTPVILMYHRVAAETLDPWQLAVAPEKFAEQLSWLTQHRTVIPLPEFADLHRRASLPGDAVAITFDDGYACTAQVAAPLLEQFRTPATIFLAADVIRSGRPFWWDELQEIILNYPELMIRLDGSTIDLGSAPRGPALEYEAGGADTAAASLLPSMAAVACPRPQ